MNRKTDADEFLAEAIKLPCDFAGDIDAEKFYGFVHRDHRFDLIEKLISSPSAAVRGCAKYVMEEVAYLNEAICLRDVAVKLAAGDMSDKLTFVLYCRDSGIFDIEVARHINQIFGGNHFVTRGYACQYTCLIGLEELNQVGRLVFEDTQYDYRSHHKFDKWEKTTNRTIRAFRMVLMCRAGFGADDIERAILLEDSFTLDMLGDAVTGRRDFHVDISPDILGLPFYC